MAHKNNGRRAFHYACLCVKSEAVVQTRQKSNTLKTEFIHDLDYVMLIKPFCKIQV